MSREMKDSGISWIGEIPSDWRIGHLKRLARIKTGSTPSRSVEEYYSEKSGLPWIKPENLNSYDSVENTAEYLTAEGRVAGTVFPQNTVFACCIASIGKIGYSNIEASCNQQINGLIYNDLINWKYGFYSNVAANNEYLARANSSVQFILNSTNQGYIQMPIPSIAEQEIISTFLDSKCAAIDQVIQKQKDIVNKLMEYKQSTITQAVTKGLNPNVKMKDSEIDWIRRIPESWDIIPLKVLFKENKKRNTDLTNSNLLSLSYGRIIQKNIDSNFGLLPDNFSKYTIVNDGDIVLRLTDLQNDHKSLRTGLVTQSGIITSAYVTLTPKKKLCSRYFHYLLHSYDIQKVFYTMGEGIRQSLSYDELSRNIRLIMPSFKEQQSIANYLDSKCLAIDESIKRSNKIIQKLEEYKKALIYNAVTGKIDCRNA
ncbi:restriction endonuclease subunit S [Enterococcus cecorum]|uniref:Restriction endonuclease subunit S n=1 Tax=Enterococcus cecorum TaxID=44008 RepID=A0A7X9NLC5_9ENTE|nr:restriction endonuclease subunit S [Enterococcus cecorum]NME49520.1 restriction endonuclease subunit S [Enterococcus cecorum]